MKRFLSVLMVVGLLAILVLPISAQSEPVTLTMNAEYNIGFECPAASTLDDTATILWVLMEPCFEPGYRLLGFNIADGTPVNGEGSDYVDVLTDLEGSWITWWKNPLAFVDSETIEIVYAETENYDTRNLRFSLSSGEVDSAPVVLDYATIEGFIPGYEGYPEETAYSPDHSLATVSDLNSIYIIDMQTGTEILRFDDFEPDTYSTVASFSQDSQHLYLATYNHPEDFSDYSAVLNIYSLPEGELLATHDVPSAMLVVSPNEEYAAVEMGSNDGTTSTLFVVHLPSGAVSEGLSLYEPPSRVMSCANRESDFSDVDFTNDGRFRLTGISWLPDSSAFVTSHSYRGNGIGGGERCVIDYSRMRIYTVTGG